MRGPTVTARSHFARVWRPLLMTRIMSDDKAAEKAGRQPPATYYIVDSLENPSPDATLAPAIGSLKLPHQQKLFKLPEKKLGPRKNSRSSLASLHYFLTSTPYFTQNMDCCPFKD